MRLALDSDYRDWFDPFFDLDGPKLPRRAAPPAGYPKREQFTTLKALGHWVVPNGPVRTLARHRDERLVVYTDEYLHAGEGKLLLFASVAFSRFPDHLASRFVATHPDEPSAWSPGQAVSRKELFIGHHKFTFTITQRAGWMTNSGDVEVTLDAHEQVVNEFYPLYAVDSVFDASSKRYLACDLNMAPGCRGLGLQDAITGPEVFAAIVGWCERFGVPTEQRGRLPEEPA